MTHEHMNIRKPKKMVLSLLSIDIIWDKVFENGPSKIL